MESSKADFEIVAHVFAALRAVAALARSAEHVGESEHVAENIAEIGEARAVETLRRRALHALMSEAIVGGAFLRIAQDAVCFVGFLELVFGRVIAGIQVGMVLAREFLVCALQPLVIAGPLDSQDFVVIAFGRAHFDEGWTATLHHRRPQQPALEIVSRL